MNAKLPNPTVALDAAIDATHRQQGDPMPTAEELIRHLNDRGYTVLPRPTVQHALPVGFERSMDEAIGDAKNVFDHADGRYEPAALALIRAAETMREHLLGDRGEERTINVLMAYTSWLASYGQTTSVPDGATDDVADMVLHFLADQRETEAVRDRTAGMRVYTANWVGADADDELSWPATAPDASERDA